MNHGMDTKSRGLLGEVTGVFIAACAAILSAGCAAQTSSPAAGAAAATAAIPRAVQPLTLEITQNGDMGRATDANGTTVPNQESRSAMPAYFTEGAKRYQLGTGTIASRGNSAVMIPARCVQEQGRAWQCWPRDRSAWLQVGNKGIQGVYYVSETGQSLRAQPPAGAVPTPTPGKEFSFARRSQTAAPAHQGSPMLLEATGSCPCNLDGLFWDPWPDCP
jgi:hypothetical protein